MRLNQETAKEVTAAISERTIAFYDAIMAIAITLMVLDMGVTEFKEFNFDAMQELFVPFTSLLISFTLLAEIWIFHARIYSLPYMHDYCSPRMSVIVLLFVCLFPKATQIIADYNDTIWSVSLYILCVAALVGLTVLSIRLSLGQASHALFKDSPIDQNNRLRVFPEDFQQAVHALSNYDELNETIKTIKRYFYLNLWEFIAMVLTTLGSTVMIMISPGWCYLFLTANIITAALIRGRINRIDMDDVFEELEIVIERIEELYEYAAEWRNAQGEVDYEAEAAELSAAEHWSDDHARRREVRKHVRKASHAHRKADAKQYKEQKRAERQGDPDEEDTE